MTAPVDISSWALNGKTRRSLAEKMVSASFTLPQNVLSKIGSAYYWNPIIFYQPDYLGNQNPVFLGFFPSSQENITAVGPEEETLTAYDYSWYLTMQYLPDNMIVMPYSPGEDPGVMTPDVFVLGCLGETLALNLTTFLYHPVDTNWNITTGIYPYAINIPPWSDISTPAASQILFTKNTTKAKAIETICNKLGWLLYVRWLVISGTWTPCAWFINEANIDLPTVSGGLGLPAMVNLTNPITAVSPPISSNLCWFLSSPIDMTHQGDDQYNFVMVRFMQADGADWSQGSAWYSNVYHPVYNPTGTIKRVEYTEDSETITTYADANTRAAAILNYHGLGIITWKMSFNLRSDLQLLQRINIAGYSAAIQGGVPDGVYRIIDISTELDQGNSVNAVSVSIISESNFETYLGLNKIFLNQTYEVQNIVQSVQNNKPDPLTGTVLSRSGTVLKVSVIQHDAVSTIYQATDPTSSINTGTVQLTPDGSGKLTATQGISIGGAAGDVNAGSVTVNGGKITANTISCSALTTSTLSSRVITLDNAGTGAVIQSSNYVAGSAGFKISGDGNAEFNNVTVRGTIATATLASGSTLTVVGNIQSSNYIAGIQGWRFSGPGDAEFHNISVVGGLMFAGGNYNHNVLFTYAAGDHLYWIDLAGVAHQIV